MNIGDIVVVPEGTENPYRVVGAYGKRRSDLLGRFLRGLYVPGFEFWFAPCCGGARKLRDAADAGVDQDEIDYYWGEDGIRRPERI